MYIYIYICVYTWKIARHIHKDTDSVGNSRKSPENDFCLTRAANRPLSLEMKRWSLVCLDSSHQAWQRTSYKPQGCCDMNSKNMLTSQGHLNVCQEYIRFLEKGMLRSFQGLRCLFLRSIGQMFLNHLCITIRHCHFLKKIIPNTTNIRRKNMHVFPHAWDGLH